MRSIRLAALTIIALLVGALAIGVTTENDDSVVSFTYPESAIVSSGGGVAPFVGAAIDASDGIIDSWLLCTGCQLSFATGSPTSGMLRWDTASPSSETLLSGMIDSAPASYIGTFPVSPVVHTVSAELADGSAPVSGASAPWSGNLNSSWSGNFNSSFSMPEASGDLVTPASSPIASPPIASGDPATTPIRVPEPGTLWLVGTAVLGVIYAARRELLAPKGPGR